MSKSQKLYLIIFIIIAVVLYLYFYEKVDFFSIFSPSSETIEFPGFPVLAASNEIVSHKYFTLSYNEEFEQANWVMYKLLASYLTQTKHKRKDNFRADNSITTGSATLSDYKKSGYDRGHLLPAADMVWSKEALSETFYMSNMSPQKPQFNRGIWKKLETRVRGWALENDELYVVTGPVFSDQLKRIGKNRVAVPKYYYKIIFDYQNPEIKAISFVMENKKLTGSLFNYAVTIDSVENLTNIDFFSELPDRTEDTIESSFNVNLWNKN